MKEKNETGQIMNDTPGFAGVICTALIIRHTHRWFVDSIAGILIGCLTCFLIRDSVLILMEGNPAKIGTDNVSGYLCHTFHDIQSVRDMLSWGLSPKRVFLLKRVGSS